MINILINEADQYYWDGLSYLIRELFLIEYGERVNISCSLTPASIWNADLIFISLCGGEALTCKKEFKYRNRGAIVGLTDNAVDKYKNIPLRYQDIILISRQASQESLYSKIVWLWNEKKEASHYPHNFLCSKCTYKKFSPQEKAIALEMIAGASPAKIAVTLNITPRKVYSHKFAMKRKFNIKNNKDLLMLLYHFFQPKEANDLIVIKRAK